ncbi:ABC transporter permease [Mesorhizobium denitrificans]|uniref:ABC transporter permease n=1 Tax=Mesorhizobium denitrificans TaxID=2294114 RepID=A0A371X2D0_9HYPH|nr:ABC transporter permease [Mesorhizobium denitrificans]RFC63204.1 ABC transporter permease [Mesorhizobium denitrificans]
MRNISERKRQPASSAHEGAGSFFNMIWTHNPVAGPVIATIVFLIAWQAASLSMPVFLPGPIAAMRGGVELFQNGQLLPYVGVTWYRVLLGWGVGVLLGIPTGWMIAQSNIVKRLVDPYINFFRFIPPIIWVTIFLLWFGYNDVTRVLLVAYATFMICVIHGTVGIISIPNEKIRAAANLGVTGWELFRRVKIPAALPDAITGMRVAMTNSFMTIIAVEMLTASSGLGYLAWTSRLYFRLDFVFISIVILGLMGLVTDRIFRFLTLRYLRRYGVHFD